MTDTPCVLFVDELLAAYPDAKVVLTTRDPDAWVESVYRSFHEILSWKRWMLLELIDFVSCGPLYRIIRNKCTQSRLV